MDNYDISLKCLCNISSRDNNFCLYEKASSKTTFWGQVLASWILLDAEISACIPNQQGQGIFIGWNSSTMEMTRMKLETTQSEWDPK